MKYIPGAALVNLKGKEEEENPTRIFSLMELGEMCAKGRIVVAFQVRRPSWWRMFFPTDCCRGVCTT